MNLHSNSHVIETKLLWLSTIQRTSTAQKNLETFYTRLQEAGSHSWLKKLEEDTIKKLIISKMSNTNIQMEFLSEVKTPHKLLNNAIICERGHANQKEILRANKVPIAIRSATSVKIKNHSSPSYPLHVGTSSSQIAHKVVQQAIQFGKFAKTQGQFVSVCRTTMPKRRSQPQQSPISTSQIKTVQTTFQ